MQNQPMVRIFLEFIGRQSNQPLFNLQRRLALRYTRAIGNPEDMRIHSNSRLAERRVQYDIGGLAADPR